MMARFIFFFCGLFALGFAALATYDGQFVSAICFMVAFVCCAVGFYLDSKYPSTRE